MHERRVKARGPSNGLADPDYIGGDATAGESDLMLIHGPRLQRLTSGTQFQRYVATAT
jgi:hypothetical protein